MARTEEVEDRMKDEGFAWQRDWTPGSDMAQDAGSEEWSAD